MPIAHSLSPVLHRAAYRALGLDWSYGARECDASGLPALLAAARGDPVWAGFSLTMPLKTSVLPLLDEVDPLAGAVGAVNTVVPAGPAEPAEPAGALRSAEQAGALRSAEQAGRPGPARLAGFNTDVAGMQAALLEAGVVGAGGRAVGRTVVLGGGGTAQAALAALAALGQRRPVVALRNPARAGDLLGAARRLGVTPDVVGWPAPDMLARADLVISTVPAGAADDLAREFARPGDAHAGAPGPGAAGGERGGPGGAGWPARTCLFDVVYSPWPTELARVATGAGAVVVGGLDLLVHQAVRQVELMTGRTVEVSVLRAAGESALRDG